MNYLALDQSLNVTGWAIFLNTRYIESGTFQIKATKPIEQRLHSILDNLNQIKLKVHGDIDHLFLEDIQYQNNKETFKKLAYVQSAIFLWCYWNDIPFTVLPPSHWRKIISDKFHIKFGRSRKEQKQTACDFVNETFHADHKFTEDECDAITLGLAGIIEKDANTSEW